MIYKNINVVTDPGEVINLDLDLMNKYVVPIRDLLHGRFTINGKSKYVRLLIQNKHLNPEIYSSNNENNNK